MAEVLWQQCLQHLRDEMSQQQFSQWISPLQAEETGEGFVLFAPNQYVLDNISQAYLAIIEDIALKLANKPIKISLSVGRRTNALTCPIIEAEKDNFEWLEGKNSPGLLSEKQDVFQQSHLNDSYTFKTFVEGKSNEIARAAAYQIGENPGRAYNPLFLYGGVGLGKTHLMHAVGNLMKERNPKCKIVYLHSERFVAGMVKALQNNTIGEFKSYCRSMDLIIIDDVQFFAGKERSQEEFFHTFNSLLEGGQQIILASDRYPRELEGIEERLKSRFGSGLTIAIQPPDLETRVAILMNKAEQYHVRLAPEIAFFIAKRIRSNVRELEGALKRVIANSRFTSQHITFDFVKDALKDLLAIQEKLVSMDNIIRTVAEYYKLKVADILAQKRTRKFARPRQLGMALCKELTTHSLPEIGEAFGGRDHTTVLHAIKFVKQNVEAAGELKDDFYNLLRILST